MRRLEGCHGPKQRIAFVLFLFSMKMDQIWSRRRYHLNSTCDSLASSNTLTPLASPASHPAICPTLHDTAFRKILKSVWPYHTHRKQLGVKHCRESHPSAGWKRDDIHSRSSGTPKLLRSPLDLSHYLKSRVCECVHVCLTTYPLHAATMKTTKCPLL